jgi:PAS domain S-box-containing protein
MKKDETTRSELRKRAEQRLKDKTRATALRLSEEEARRALHELEVHQVELEMQNEALRAARLETEAGLAAYTALFDFAPIGYATLLTDGTMRAVNHAGARLLGRLRSELVGSNFITFVATRDTAQFLHLIATVAHHDNEGGSDSCEVELRRDGEAQPARLTATALSGTAQTTVLLAFEDIAEQKKREERIARTEGELREVNRRKDEFLAALSHELRNPLAPMRNSLFVLERAEPGGERASKAHAILERQMTHLTRLVDDLLDVARIERGKVELQRHCLELGDVVRHTMDDHRASFESCGIRLSGRFDPGLFWVDADAARLVQVLSNLLGNALKFTPREGDVAVTLEREGPHVALRVRDSGSGIDPARLPHIFEAFVQAPQPIDRVHGGLGLGLAMVKGLVEVHGGTVEVSSEGLGKGTELTVRLPMVSAPIAQTSPPAARRRTNAGAAASSSSTITWILPTAWPTRSS